MLHCPYAEGKLKKGTVSEFSPDIWRLQAQSDIRGLLEAVKHTHPDVRRRAVAALRALGASSAIPALQAALVKERHPEVRAALIVTLDSLFQQEIEEDSDSPEDLYNRVVRLIAQLSSQSPERVIRAAKALGEMKEKIAAESLILVFHNREQPGRVRLAAAEALLKLESAPVDVALLGALRHADWRVRRNAAAVLGQLNADWAVGPLGDALKGDAHELVRRTAHAALSRIGTQEAYIALAEAAAEETRLRPPVGLSPPPAEAQVETPSSPPPVDGKTPPPVEAQGEAAPPSPDPASDALPPPDEEDTQPSLTVG